MEIFGRSLSDFKKLLIIVVVVVLVLLLVGVVVPNFILNIPGGVTYEPEADVDFTQVEIPNSSGNKTSYMIDVYVESIEKERTDYLIVTKFGSKENSRFVKDASIDSSQIARAPDYPSQSESVSQPSNGEVLLSESDSTYVIGVEEGDRVQVFGGISGRESLVASYEVK